MSLTLDKGGSFLVPPTSIRRRIERTISSPSFEGHRVWPLHVPFRASLRIDSEELFPELAVCSKGITPLSYHLIVLRSIVWILPQEHREDSIVAEDVTIVIGITPNSYCRRGTSLLERHTRERDGILILRQFKQHVAHLVASLDDVRQSVEGGVVQHIADHVRVDDSTKFVVHERTSVDAYQRLSSRPDVIRSQIRAVCKLDIYQAIDRNSRVSGKLDEGVEGESQAVVQFVCQVLKETRVVNCNVQGKVGTVNEISILPDSRDNFIAGFTDRTSDGSFRCLIKVGGKQSVGEDFCV